MHQLDKDLLRSKPDLYSYPFNNIKINKRKRKVRDSYLFPIFLVFKGTIFKNLFNYLTTIKYNKKIFINGDIDFFLMQFSNHFKNIT